MHTLIGINAHFTATIEKTTDTTRRPAVLIAEATVLVGYLIGTTPQIGCTNADSTGISARLAAIIRETTATTRETTATTRETTATTWETTATFAQATATTSDLIATICRPTTLNAEATATNGCLTCTGARPVCSLDEIDGHVARTIPLKNPLLPPEV